MSVGRQAETASGWSFGAARSRAEVRSRDRATLACLAVLALAAWLQIRFGAFGDVSWLITESEGWLDGKRPYVDFIETNPPAAILLYIPPTWLARALHWRPEFVVAVYGLTLAAASTFSIAAILTRAGLIERPGRTFAFLTLVALTILPGRTFDERDFFALLFGLPFVALVAARASSARASLSESALAGVGLGLMIAVKPPYATIPALLALYSMTRIGFWRAALCPELAIAAGLVIGYGALCWFAFPAYFSDVLPDVTLAYLPVRETLATLIANAGLVCILTLGGVIVAMIGRRALEPLPFVFGLASIGALIAFFVQGKGWLYHIYPALALMMMAYGAALEKRARDPLALALAVAIASATVLAAILFDLAPIPAALTLAIVARLLLARFAIEDDRERLSILAGGALVGASCGLYCLSFPGPTPDFLRTLTSYAPHPRIATIGEGLGIGFPLTRNVDGVWTMRAQGMLMTAGARRLSDERPGDAELATRLAPVIARDRDRAAEDIEANRPDALLISRHGPRFHAWAMADAKLSAARAPYRFVMSNADPNWPVDLYVRQDLIALRGGL